MRLSRRQSLKGIAAAATIPSVALSSRRAAPPAIRLVVLDVGGTIIEDRGDIPETLRRALKHHGIDSTPEEIARLRGASKREVVRHFVDQSPAPNGDRDQLTSAVYSEFSASIIEIYRTVPPIAGAEDAIRQFAGEEIEKAKYYDFDPAYLLELEPTVTHYEVFASPYGG